MNPFKEILNRASRALFNEGDPALVRIHPELRDMLFSADPGKFDEAIKTVNTLLTLTGERSLTR